MSTPQQRTERISLLKEVTGIEDDGTATHLLNKNAWDVQHAVQEYLSGGSGTQAPTSIPPSSSTNGHVRRRSTSPGSERRIRARQQQLMQQQREGGGGGGGGEFDDSMMMGGGEEDNAPLLGRSGSVTGGGGGAAAMEVEGGGAGRVGGGGGASSLVALPFHLAGSVLRTLLAPVRYITGSGGDGEMHDPKRAAELFIEAYEKQYHCAPNEGGGGGGGAGGARPRPRFLPLSFHEATRLAAREQKFLVVYLHAPLHEHTPSFLSQILNTDTLTSFLDDNLVVWGGSIHSADAYHTSQLLDASAFPFLALLACHDAPHLTVLEHMEGLGGDGGREGGIGVEGVLQRLTAAMARQQEVLARQEAAMRERTERIRLQEEQNREYQEALEADRKREADLAAERERVKEEEEREKKMMEEANEERERKRREAAERTMMIKARLPAEPPMGDKAALRLRLQFPHGKKMDRRFDRDDTLQVVRDFIDVSVAEAEEEGWGDGSRKLVNYSLSTPYPKRTFGEEEVGKTLAEVGLHSADTIYIQDLDA
ncbi:hypothetical protein VYU27_004315 [Nannochloropsis oceanica]